jgi:hypothetical protein
MEIKANAEDGADGREPNGGWMSNEAGDVVVEKTDAG